MASASAGGALWAGAGRGRTGLGAGHGVRAVRTINTTKSATAAKRTALPIRRPFGIGYPRPVKRYPDRVTVAKISLG